jgi:beta-phosphoglucomutase
MNSLLISTLSEVPELTDLKTRFINLKSILFDMDGTLFNTEKYHAIALKNLGEELKIRSPLSEKEMFHLMVGKADHLLFDIIKDWPRFPVHLSVEEFIHRKNNHLLNILSQTNSEQYFSEKLRILLTEIKKNNFFIGLVTSSEKIITHELLKSSQITDLFNFILTRDDSLKVKPDPWPYLYTINQSCFTPQETLIFEDSQVGIEAAEKSGANVLKANWYRD